MKINSDPAVKSEINITPLVDVVLVLLIIFMVVTPMIVSQGIQLPDGKNAGPAPDRKISKTISLTEAGLLYFEYEPVTEQALIQRLNDLHLTDPDAQVVMRADRRIVYGQVHRILDLAAGAGFRNLALLADPGISRGAVENAEFKEK